VTPELIGIFLYLIAQVLIGIWVMKRIRSESDFFLAGRSLGLGLATFSIFATWFGAETCIGTSGAVYTDGLSGSRADPFGYTICLILAGLLLAMPLWNRKLTTMGDLFRQRYGGKTELFASLLMIPTSIIWASAQIRAFGQIVAASSPINLELAMSIAAIVIIVYSVLGGLLADVITDFVQGISLIVGLLVMLVVVLLNLPEGWTAAFTPDRTTFIKPDESLLSHFDSWLIPILGSLAAQELISRMLACRTAEISRRATFVGAGVYFLVGSIPLFLGLLGPSLLPSLIEPEQFLVTLAHNKLGLVLGILFSGALVSAIMSTVDSALLAAGSLASHNILPILRGRELSERGKVVSARLSVAAAGIIAWILALGSESIYGQVELASSFGSSGIVVICLFGLYSTRGNETVALFSLFTGVATMLAGNLFEWEGVYVISVLASAIVFLVSSQVVKRK
jgi:Na+/proline symporter